MKNLLNKEDPTTSKDRAKVLQGLIIAGVFGVTAILYWNDPIAAIPLVVMVILFLIARAIFPRLIVIWIGLLVFGLVMSSSLQAEASDIKSLVINAIFAITMSLQLWLFSRAGRQKRDWVLLLGFLFTLGLAIWLAFQIFLAIR